MSSCIQNVRHLRLARMSRHIHNHIYLWFFMPSSVIFACLIVSCVSSIPLATVREVDERIKG